MSKRGEKIHLIIIDPQVDFCRPGAIGSPERGALYVDNAENDMANVASMIDRYGAKIDRIHVTLDCHLPIDVAHSLMWVNPSTGKHPDVFTIFGSKEIRDGVWSSIYPDQNGRFINYCEELERTKRYPLCIWPPHCLIGTPGNAVLPVLSEALLNWTIKTETNVNFVSKGSNLWTEHYSAIQAEVPDPADASTGKNAELLDLWDTADQLLWAGEALSHCLKSTMEDAVALSSNDDYLKKVVLFTDGTSPVQSPVVDFPAISKKFVDTMVSRGMKTALTTDF